MLALLLALSLGGTVRLGPYAFAPPPGFSRDDALAGAETAALAPLAAPGEPDRRLVGFFRTDDPDPSTFALSTVAAPLTFEPSSKATLAAAVDAHFRRELDLPFTLERTHRVPGTPGRIEVWGHVSIEGKARELCVAFFAGRRAHAIAVASMPTESAAALEPKLEAALSSLHADEPPEPLAERRTAITLGVWAAAAAAFLAARLYRKRRAAQLD